MDRWFSCTFWTGACEAMRIVEHNFHRFSILPTHRLAGLMADRDHVAICCFDHARSVVTVLLRTESPCMLLKSI